MSNFDVRDMSNTEVTMITFANDEHGNGTTQAYYLEKAEVGDVIKIYDGQDDYVYLTSKDHAEHLIKAIHKAFELGWLK